MPNPPSRGGVTSAFGMRVHPITGVYRMHFGEDTIGDGNYAPVNGVVVYAGWHTSSGFGNVVGIREDGTGCVWWVAHHASIAVAVGQRVVANVTRLGEKGMTGAANGPHAHTERRAGGGNTPLTGTATNPRDYYSSAAGGGGAGFPGGLTTMSKLVLHVVGKDQAYYLADLFTTTICTDQNDITAYRDAYGEIRREGPVAMDPFIRTNLRNLAAVAGAVDNVIDDEATIAALQKLSTSSAGPTLTAEQLASLAQQIAAASNADLLTVLKALKANVDQLPALINQVDENTLAGLHARLAS